MPNAVSPKQVGRAPHGRHSEAEFYRRQNELILHAAGEGIYGLDLDGRVTFANPAAAAMTGHTVDELLGQHMHDLVHHSTPSGVPVPRERCAIYAAFVDGTVHCSDSDVFWRKDGSSFPVEYTSTPIREDGTLVGAVVVFSDITERRRAMAQLQGALQEVQCLKERLQQENAYLKQEIGQATGVGPIVGSSYALRCALNAVERVAPTDATVLIQGETGTGKELVARAVHDMSARNEGPMVKLNCGAMPPTLVESELFGHERGAFTGAVERRQGRFELADGGTLFLDEVAELPMETQASLLRALQEGEFERVGGSRTLHTDVRVVAATHRNLKALVEEGRFRADLFYRLHVFPITLPPLRERLRDVPELVDAYLGHLSSRLGRPVRGVSEASMRRLISRQHPGAAQRAGARGHPLDRPHHRCGPLVRTPKHLEPRRFDPPERRGRAHGARATQYPGPRAQPHPAGVAGAPMEDCGARRSGRSARSASQHAAVAHAAPAHPHPFGRDPQRRIARRHATGVPGAPLRGSASRGARGLGGQPRR